MSKPPPLRDLYPPAPMVGWFSPSQLLRTAGKVVVSSILGNDLDRRLFKDLAVAEITDASQRDAITLDFISDTGDGWNPTYAVAYWATRPRLEVAGPDGELHPLPRADVLVFGGDQVYPTPSRTEYEQRLVMPYECALDYTDAPHPVAFAIPGNHDWYDNLASFSKLFLDKAWFCGWRLPQRCSYFAVRLPHGWWLVGVDVQLGSDLDLRQVEFFRDVARQMGDDAKIVLVTAEPHWVSTHEITDPQARERRRRDSNLVFLEDQVFGGKVRAFLSGDLHHYRRHASADGQFQKITAGGGGAFLHPTHTLRDDPLDGGFDLRCAFPDVATSRRLPWANLGFLVHNPGFGAMMGFIYMLVGWNLFGPLADYPSDALGAALPQMLNAALRSPSATTWVLLTALGFVVFTDTSRTAYRVVGGLVHAAAHIFAALLLGWLSGQIGKALELEFHSTLQVLLSLAVLCFGGWLVSAVIIGLYLLISINVFRVHANEAFSSLAIQDYKHFLRLRIGPDGALTIYPIGLPRVPRRWRRVPDAGRGAAKFEPEDLHPDARPRLIEAPIVLRPEPPT